MPAARHAAVTVGKRRSKPAMARASRYAQGSPVARSLASMAPATTSRGARAPIGGTPAGFAGAVKPGVDGPRADVAWRQVAHRVDACGDRIALPVEQYPALTTDGF